MCAFLSFLPFFYSASLLAAVASRGCWIWIGASLRPLMDQKTLYKLTPVTRSVYCGHLIIKQQQRTKYGSNRGVDHLSALFMDFHAASCWSAAFELVSVGLTRYYTNVKASKLQASSACQS